MSAGAFAHSVLLDIDPKDGGIYGESPSEARLRFNEPVTPVTVRLFHPDGASEVLAPRALDKDVVAPFPPALAGGTYLLSYRVVSRDGHPLGGSVAFSIGGVTGTPPAPVAAPRWEIAFPILHGIALAALLLACGGAAFIGFAVPNKATATRAMARRCVPIAAVVGAVAGLAAVGVRGAGLAESPIAEFFSAPPWRIALATPLGLGLALSVAGAALAAVSVRRGGARLVVAGAMALLAWGLASTSHAALAPPIAVSFAAYTVHVGVAAFWLGSLPLLAVALAREPPPLAASTIAAFSRIAVWAVAALVIAGIGLTFVQTGADLSVWLGPAWTGTAYGGLLAAKVGAALVVLALAVRNKRVLTASVAKGEGAPLRRSIFGEGVFMVVVIGLAATLASTEPPRSIAALGAVHDHASVDTGVAIEATRDGVQILLEVDPAAPGDNELIVHFFDAAKGEHIYPRDVFVAASLPDGGVEPLRRPAISQGDGTYKVGSIPLPVPGTWQIRIEALLTDFDKLIVTMELPLESQ